MIQLNFLLIAIFFITSAVMANEVSQPLSAADKFEQGMTFFKNKQYLSARAAFIQAKSEKYNDSSLTYNLGVVNYKLGFYPSAEQYFLDLTNDPKYQALAFYNLALIGFKMEQIESATAWLEQCIATSKSESLSQLAHGLLQKSDGSNQLTANSGGTEIRMAEFQKPDKKIKTFIKSLAGHDDNVTQYLAYSKRKFNDVFYDVQLDATYSAFRNITLQSSMYFHLYTNAINYNTSEFSLAINYANHIRQWHYVVRSELRKQMIYYKNFQQLSDIGFDISYPISQNLSSISSYNLQLVRIENPLYDHLGGYVNQWKQEFEYRYNSLYFAIAYSYEQNQRKDHYIHDNVLASSFSPRTHSGEASILYSGQKANVELYGKSTLSKFPDKNILHPDSINQRNIYQKSSLIDYGLRLSWKVHKNLYAIAKFYHERNYSNIALYRYEKNVYQTGISWQF